MVSLVIYASTAFVLRKYNSFFSERELTVTFTICYRPSVYRVSVVCVCVSRLKFAGMFLRHLVPWIPVDVHGKFYGDRPMETPPAEGLNARWVAKHSDFGPIEDYISETVQDRR